MQSWLFWLKQILANFQNFILSCAAQNIFAFQDLNIYNIYIYSTTSWIGTFADDDLMMSLNFLLSLMRNFNHNDLFVVL